MKGHCWVLLGVGCGVMVELLLGKRSWLGHDWVTTFGMNDTMRLHRIHAHFLHHMTPITRH